ncbi:MAG: hypothetical protein Q4B73_00320 [Lachnospiraceae bacterium]|nr:hypothetical protein [Lachnospiraceae bacterium]
MDITEKRVEQFKKKARKIVIGLLAAAVVIVVTVILLYLYTDAPIYPRCGIKDRYDFRATTDKVFQIQVDREWQDFEIRGIELDATLNEEDYDIYVRWLTAARELNANVVSVRSLMPPDFYRALRDVNEAIEAKNTGATDTVSVSDADNEEKAATDKATADETTAAIPDRLYLLQNITLSDDAWAEMTDMVSGGMVRQFKKQGRLTVDAIHGNRRNKGYRVDVSELLLGYVIGGQWDPDLVIYTNYCYGDSLNNGPGEHNSYINAWDNTAAVTHLIADAMDDVVYYESNKYAWLHPMGVGNTQKTDALPHDNSWAVGTDENVAVIQTASLGAEGQMRSGIFAAYEINTGVMNNLSFDPTYARAEGGAVQAYMKALDEGHFYMPVLLYSATMSAARGTSGIDEVAGFDRGGIGEAGQAEGLTYMYDMAQAAGLAGTVLGQIVDAPQKSSANTFMADHNGAWLDVQNPEGALGVIGLYPENGIVLDGNADEWADVPALIDEDGVEMKATADAAYLNLMIKADALKANSSAYVAFDVTPHSGAKTWQAKGLRFEADADFVLVLGGDAQGLLVGQRYYQIPDRYYAAAYDDIWYADAPERDADDFVAIHQYQRAEMIPLTGEAIPAVFAEAGKLAGRLVSTNGHTTAAADEASENGAELLPEVDVCRKGDLIEVRIPWLLLNVTDPSEGMILQDIYTWGIGSESIESIGLELFVGAGQPVSAGTATLDFNSFDNVTTERQRAAAQALAAVYAR